MALEKSNREITNNQIQFEETIKKINQESDPETRMKLLNVNLFRRKSLLRAEKPQIPNSNFNKSDTTEEELKQASFSG